MKGMIRLTVTMPAKLLEDLETKLAREDESRSAVVRRLIQNALWLVEEREKDEQFVRVYTEQPQTEEEFGWASVVALEALKHIPWDEPNEKR